MADRQPNEVPAVTKPVTKAPGNATRAQMRRSIASFTLAAQAIGDRLMLPEIPAGARGVRHRMQSSVSLGTSTLALGITGNTGKYRAAATLAVTTPEEISSAVTTAAELATAEKPFLTVAVAALPGAGTLTVETIYNI